MPHLTTVSIYEKQGSDKKIINYFSDLIFKQPDYKGVLPATLPVMTLLVFENNNEQIVRITKKSLIKSLIL